MKLKWFLLLLLLSTGVLSEAILAQSLIVQMKNGDEHITALEPVQKLSFLSEELIITYNTGSSDGYALSEIRKLYFQTPVAIGENEDECDALLVYPNPAYEYITVQGISEDGEQLVIYRTDGLVVHSETVNAGNAKISIGHLTQGLYLVYLSGRITKFVKL